MSSSMPIGMECRWWVKCVSWPLSGSPSVHRGPLLDAGCPDTCVSWVVPQTENHLGSVSHAVYLVEI